MSETKPVQINEKKKSGCGCGCNGNTAKESKPAVEKLKKK